MSADLRDSTQARFWAKVDKRGSNDCWLWTGARSDLGAGSFQGKPASHYALLLDGRPRPDTLWALHSCDNHPCVNPAHLRWGTREENTQDYRERGHLKRATTKARWARLAVHMNRGPVV